MQTARARSPLRDDPYRLPCILSMSASDLVGATPNRVTLAAAHAAALLEEIRLHYPAGAHSALPAGSIQRLQASICDYAAALRENGDTPEQAVKHTKFLIARTMREIDLYPGCLMDAVVGWAIEGYHTARGDEQRGHRGNPSVPAFLPRVPSA